MHQRLHTRKLGLCCSLCTRACQHTQEHKSTHTHTHTRTHSYLLSLTHTHSNTSHIRPWIPPTCLPFSPAPDLSEEEGFDCRRASEALVGFRRSDKRDTVRRNSRWTGGAARLACCCCCLMMPGASIYDNKHPDLCSHAHRPLFHTGREGIWCLGTQVKCMCVWLTVIVL